MSNERDAAEGIRRAIDALYPNMTLLERAERLGLSESYLSRLMRGEFRWTVKTVRRIRHIHAELRPACDAFLLADDLGSPADSRDTTKAVAV